MGADLARGRPRRNVQIPHLALALAFCLALLPALRDRSRGDTMPCMIPLPRVAPGRSFEPIRIVRGTRVFVLTGAGISAESGIRTFRDAGGLWEEHRIEDVATPEGFVRNPPLVWRFYSERRLQAAHGTAQPRPRATPPLGDFP